MKKIAFCFLIYDIINQEEVWNLFFKDIDPNKYSIYIHYKNNVTLKYFEKYKLKNCIETKYADISIVKAQNLLLKEGLNDTLNEHFIFLSNSCIPLKSFEYIYNILNPNYSYFSEAINFIKMSHYIDKKYLKKSHQWCILYKKHAYEILSPIYEVDRFKDLYASDEHYNITNMYMKNLHNQIIFRNSENKLTTYVNWSEGNGIRPFTYYIIEDIKLQKLLNNKNHLFARKFDKSCELCNKEYYIKSITDNNIDNNKIQTIINDDMNDNTIKNFEPITYNNINYGVKRTINKNNYQIIVTPQIDIINKNFHRKNNTFIGKKRK